MKRTCVWRISGLALWALVALGNSANGQQPNAAGAAPAAGTPAGAPTVPAVDPKIADDKQAAAAAAAILEGAYQGTKPPESVRMLVSILRGSQMGPNDGWFGPAQSRYSYGWLAQKCGAEPAAGPIPRAKFPGGDPHFARLDRDKNGAISPEELDWSDRNPLIQVGTMATRIFRRLDGQADGRLTKEELQQFFDRVAAGKDHVTADDFRDAMIAGMTSGFQPGDAPAPSTLVRGLFAGEIGSLQEGPAVGQAAPNFVLKSVDGQQSIELAKRVGTKPVVLVFGNFTCGPFRSLYPEVEAVYQRWKNDAEFVMVYVREAHPTDGWKMASNERAGVAVAQPTTFEERTKVAEQFCGQLKPTLPVAVDDINDVVGNAYSGMPARLYVLDRAGRVAYKSGRGPFGFKPGEMEQALVMCLIE